VGWLGSHLVGQLGSGPRLTGQIGLGVWVSASFKINACLRGLLESGPRLVADRADVVFTDTRVYIFCLHFIQ